ncbi:pyridoxal kinase-like isoform X2 [Montipora capricornis]|uniref:pyridoxal kinase-like n=1 Tax=Montipora foliosa TaxID=591990 RepID=UPI0035F18E2F
MASSEACRVLSIQSHVVSGYVGNDSATFPLQVLGFEVDTINSVQLSNHTGYEHMKGQVLDSKELKALFEGLKLNNLHHFSHLLTGYVGSKSFLEELLQVIHQLREANPNLIFVCDPVMGDAGEFYVPEELMPVYRDGILPLADIITPNQFEAELLSGMKITNESEAFKAMTILHERGTKTVVLTSSDLGDHKTLIALGSTVKGDHKNIRIEIPKLDAVFTGTGDLFASVLLAWLHRHPNDLALACEATVSTVQAVLHRTLAHAQRLAGEGNRPTAAQIELRLIQSLDDIRNPSITFKAQPVAH